MHKDDRAPYLLPASSVKGAIRRRTAFHARRLSKEWYEWEQQISTHEGFTPQEVLLFGERHEKDKGSPGRVFISDLYIARNEVNLQALQHVSLDRFTQGPMDHLLFDELALVGGQVVLDIVVDVGRCQSDPIALRALDAALRDLYEGRLTLGAGRGHGRFTGTPMWMGNKRLIQEETAVC